MSTPADNVASPRREPLSNFLDTSRIEQRLGHLLFTAVLTVVPFAVLLLLVLWKTSGHFTYSLDDPYIHLVLARNIWHGHYGINPSEFSAPSSSILWPFLLAPFSASGRIFDYVPLAINFLCLWGTIAVLCRIFSDLRVFVRMAAIGSIAVSLNLYGLVFIGMEHSLQVLLVVVGMLPLVDYDSGKGALGKVPAYVVAALIALPLVRYEGLAISLPMLIFLFVHGQRKTAALSVAAIAVSAGSFSAFLHAHGLGYLPSSVLAKADLSGLHGIGQNLKENLKAYGFILLPVAWIFGAWWKTGRSRGFVLLAATATHFVFGHHGWFGRYEVYYVLFVVVLGARLAVDSGLKLVPAILCLPFAFQSLTMATLTTPEGTENIYSQQAQMSRIAAMLGAPVAVNDLGLVALRSGQYTLDLWGLGSIEALHNRMHGNAPDWIAALMARKHVQYAFVYDEWFPNKPATWIKVGELELAQAKITPFSDRVGLYAVDPSSAGKLRSTLTNFAQQGDPRHFTVTIY